MQAKNKTLSTTRRTFLTSFTILAAALSLAGCGGGGNDSSGSSQTRQVVEQTTGPFRVTASIPKQTYRKGEDVKITFTVTNTSTEDLTVDWFPGNSQNGTNLGGRLGQVSVRRGETLIYDSLPSRGEYAGFIVKAGDTVTEQFKWNQSDISGYSASQYAYDTSFFVANTASAGQYQMIPRLNLPLYSAASDASPFGTYLNNGAATPLPPLSITINP